MLRVHHDMRTHCNMRHTIAGETILNILTSLITIVSWNALPQVVVSSPTLEAFKTSLRRSRMSQICNLDSGGGGGGIVITLY